jgi:hypothetical protein
VVIASPRYLAFACLCVSRRKSRQQAKQNGGGVAISPYTALDCFVAALLAMTGAIFVQNCGFLLKKRGIPIIFEKFCKNHRKMLDFGERKRILIFNTHRKRVIADIL